MPVPESVCSFPNCGKETVTPHLGNPVLDELKGAAGALHGVLCFLQRHAALTQVPHHVLHLALHCVCPAPGADRAEGREWVGRNEEASGSTYSPVQENVLLSQDKGELTQ